MTCLNVRMDNLCMNATPRYMLFGDTELCQYVLSAVFHDGCEVRQVFRSST